jgi:DNA-binding CsgD family transcriptional regulator
MNMSGAGKMQYADVFARLQTVQDELSERLGFCLVLVDRRGGEATLPSGMPLACNRRECTAKRPACLQSPPAQGEPVIARCPFGLYWTALFTSLQSSEGDLYLHVGRTARPEQVAAELPLLREIYTLPFAVPVSARKGSTRAVPDADPLLTAQERKVLACLAAGLPNKEIAQRMCISQSTVKSHISSVFKKLGLTNRTEASVYALKNGISLEAEDV